MDSNMQTKMTRSAGGVVISEQGKVLVVNQKGNSWSLPKGHVEEGEEILDAAKREIWEESGVSELELIKEYPMYERFKISTDGTGEDTTEMKLIFMFLFRTKQIELKPRDEDNPEALWIEPQRVSEMLTHHKDRKFYEGVLTDITMHILSKAGQKHD